MIKDAPATIPPKGNAHAAGSTATRSRETGARIAKSRRRLALAARAMVPRGSALPAPLLNQVHGPRNVSASVL